LNCENTMHQLQAIFYRGCPCGEEWMFIGAFILDKFNMSFIVNCLKRKYSRATSVEDSLQLMQLLLDYFVHDADRI
jgi:hypothetical protein